MNEVLIIGNLGQDAKIISNPNYKMITFSLAIKEKNRNPQSGEITEKTTWVNCKCYENKHSPIADRMLKGARVLVKGKIQENNYKNKETGLEVKGLVVQGTVVEPIGNSASAKPATAKPKAAPRDDEEEVYEY